MCEPRDQAGDCGEGHPVQLQVVPGKLGKEEAPAGNKQVMDGRQKYLMFKNIADIAIQNKGKIFGGYVRDFILKDEASKEFYKAHKAEDFSNPEVSPETSDRLLIPSDIDVHFKTHAEYKKFRMSLNRGFFVSNVTITENFYTTGNQVKHIKLTVRLGVSKHLPLVKEILDSCLPDFSVNVDVIVCSGDANTLLDFECNGLIMDNTGIHLCTQMIGSLSGIGVHRTFMKVLDDIKHKRAVVVTFNPKRWDKMAEKPNGWDLLGSSVEKIHKGGDMCIICHEIIESDVYKFDCCKAKYHLNCMPKAIQFIRLSNSCLHCRQDLYITEIVADAFAL